MGQSGIIDGEFKTNWEWAQGHEQSICAIIQQQAGKIVTVRRATQDEDIKQATDMVVVIEAGSVAVRIRRPKYTFRDLTIRAYGSFMTELDKIKSGKVRWYLYGWSDGRCNVSEWMLIDLQILHTSGLLDGRKVTMNKDGKTGFIKVHWKELQSVGCLVAKNIHQAM